MKSWGLNLSTSFGTRKLSLGCRAIKFPSDIVIHVKIVLGLRNTGVMALPVWAVGLCNIS